MDEKEATQVFAIRNIIIGHCGESLTPSNVEKICAEIEKEMREGPCSWAFT